MKFSSRLNHSESCTLYAKEVSFNRMWTVKTHTTARELLAGQDLLQEQPQHPAQSSNETSRAAESAARLETFSFTQAVSYWETLQKPLHSLRNIKKIFKIKQKSHKFFQHLHELQFLRCCNRHVLSILGCFNMWSLVGQLRPEPGSPILSLSPQPKLPRGDGHNLSLKPRVLSAPASASAQLLPAPPGFEFWKHNNSLFRQRQGSRSTTCAQNSPPPLLLVFFCFFPVPHEADHILQQKCQETHPPKTHPLLPRQTRGRHRHTAQTRGWHCRGPCPKHRAGAACPIPGPA